MNKKDIKEIEKECFTWFYNQNAQENKFKMFQEEIKPSHGKLGKYLFFSDDREKLQRLLKEILLKFNLYCAKISTEKREKTDGFGFVMCIYDFEPKFKYNLKKYADETIIKYRYWKSDSDTIKGKYSEKFLEND